MVGLLGLHTAVFLSLSGPVSSLGPAAALPRRCRDGRAAPLFSSATKSNGKRPSPPIASKPQQHVVVVGGGVGGMAVAARIASDKSVAAAASTAATTTRVTLLEKNGSIGGRCGSFWVDPEEQNDNVKAGGGDDSLFRHEQGPSLLLLPKVYEDVFTDTTSKTPSDYGLDIVRCTPAYQIVFDDGDRITVGFPEGTSASTRDAESESRAKMDAYEASGAEKWDDYMAITAAYLDAGLPNFIEERLDLWSLPNFLVQSLKGGGKAWPLRPHSDVLDELFESDKLRALASFQDLYVGLEPYRNDDLLGGGVLRSTAPAVFGLLAAIELHPSNKNAGVFAPIGGFQAVTNAMENLLDELGVEIRCGTTVTGVTSDGVWAKTTTTTTTTTTTGAASEESGGGDGVENDDNEFIPADLVIVNADLPYAKKSLLMKEGSGGGTSPQLTRPAPPSTEKFDWDDGFSFSSGVISFYWSLDKPLDDLNTHNVFLSTKSRTEAEASWQVLREPQPGSKGDGNNEENSDGDAPFNFYVHRPSKTDPSAAPAGCDAVMVLVPCRTLLRDEECAGLPRDEAMKRYEEQFSPAVVSRARQAVLKRFAAVESLKGLEDHILHEEHRTPATWAERYNLAAGTPFALSHGFAQLSVTRPGPKSSGLPNVLYCGASTRPGNGVPLVLIGAKQVAEKAAQALCNTND